MYDAIIVGARCAGSPTAMLLARRGYRVLLVDRATFPSDIMSTHYIHQKGVAALQRWGLLDRLIATGCPPITQFALDVGAFTLVGSPPPVDGVADGYGPRRKVIDKLLVDAAVEAGVEMREAFTIQELVWDGDRVTGVRGHSAGGPAVVERARVVIGADGLHSLVARAVQAPTYHEKPAISCAYYSYWSGVPVESFEIHLRPHRAAWAIPTNDGLTLIGVGWPHSEFATYRSDIEGNYLKTIEQAPSLAERVHDGKREERFVGTADMPNFFRKPYGPGWALVGDAGYHKDPTTAQGMSDAFRDAESLVEALDAGFTNRLPLDEALAAYEQQRNEASLPMYEYTCQFATLEPPPEMQQMLSALRGNQHEADQFFGTLSGAVSIPEFFAPEHLMAIAQPLTR
ncbi:MAG TPA: NAD(P)/FAD-dependent oxidoreductase [Ktedonobacterales bacterium]|nr:NAD(P)/FAD-dependent oxidoreductase [Ktedonobacterales bacterium]